MITQKLPEMIAQSLKAGNHLRTETLRMLSSAFNYERIALQHDLTDQEELSVIKRQAKQRRDSIDAYNKAGSPERAKKEQDELDILSEFLPPEMEDSELEKIVVDSIAEIKASSMADMGKVIGAVKSKAPDVDGGRVAQMVKSKLNIS